MLRLMGHVIPDNKSIWIGLTTIYGIGRKKSQTILDKIGVDFMTKVKNLSDEQEKKISEELQTYLLENDLKREIMTHIKRLKEIKCLEVWDIILDFLWEVNLQEKMQELLRNCLEEQELDLFLRNNL